MDDKVKIAIIGCGRIGSVHVKAYKELKEKGIGNFEIVAVCDLTREKAENLAQKIRSFQSERIPVYTNFDKAIKPADAIDICTLHHTHHTLAITAMETGKHVIVEKPMGITMRAARKMVEVAERNKKILAVAENSRRKLRNRAIKWILEQGYIGQPQMMFQGGVGLSQITPELRIGAPNWGKDCIIVGTPWRHIKLKVGAGCVLDNGIHDADVLRYFNGEIKEISGIVRTLEAVRVKKNASGQIIEKVKNTAEDSGFALLEYENGTICNWFPSYWAGHGEASPLVQWIYGKKGCVKGDKIILDDGSQNNVEHLFLSKADPTLKERQFPRSIGNSYAIEIYDYIDSIINGRKPETDGWEGLRTEAICYGVIESSYIKSPVNVRDIENCKIEEYQKEINEAIGL